MIAIGSNGRARSSARPRAICEAAFRAVSARRPHRQALPWFESAAGPVPDQAWFVNGVAIVERAGARGMLALLHEVERRFGRERREVNAARILDLDLIAYGASADGGAAPVPHLACRERAFVLLPFADVARVASSHRRRGLDAMIRDLPSGQWHGHLRAIHDASHDRRYRSCLRCRASVNIFRETHHLRCKLSG